MHDLLSNPSFDEKDTKPSYPPNIPDNIPGEFNGDELDIIIDEEGSQPSEEENKLISEKFKALINSTNTPKNTD